jgi:hypothetical protein
MTPKDRPVIVRNESPIRQPHGILKPESDYFRAEESSANDNDAQSSPGSQGSRDPDLGSLFELKARNPRAFDDVKQNKREEARASRWKDYDTHSETEDHRRPAELLVQQIPAPYPQPYPASPGLFQYPPTQVQYAQAPGYPQTGMPQTLMYQTPDGRLVPYEYTAPMPHQNNAPMPPPLHERSDISDTRSDVTHEVQRDDDKSSYVDNVSEFYEPREERKSAERVIRIERPIARTSVNKVHDHLHHPKVNKGIQPFNKEEHQRTSSREKREYEHEDHRRNVHEAHPINSKLGNLYKRREYEARPEPEGRIRSPPRDGYNAGILGIPREQVMHEEMHPIHHPPHTVIQHSQTPEFIHHAPAPEFINHAPPPIPHQNIVQQIPHASTSGVRPDPVDIDEDFSYIPQDISDPEDLQRAFVSGLRQPDQKPMSLQRFRSEYRDDITPATKNIDQFSDSDYSVVEQAYKDMEEFDTRVDLYRHDIVQTRVADDRTFRNHK